MCDFSVSLDSYKYPKAEVTASVLWLCRAGDLMVSCIATGKESVIDTDPKESEDSVGPWDAGESQSTSTGDIMWQYQMRWTLLVWDSKGLKSHR